MNKEGADLRGLPLRIKQRIFPGRPAVAAKECLAFAPATTANDYRFRPGFHNEVRSIRDQLAIHAIDRLQRAFDLSGSVIRRLQSADRGINQRTQDWDVRRNGLAKGEIHDLAASAKVYQANVWAFNLRRAC